MDSTQLLMITNDITHTTDGPVTRFVAICRAVNLVRHGRPPSDVAGVLYSLLFGNQDDAMLDGTPVPTTDLNTADGGMVA